MEYSTETDCCDAQNLKNDSFRQYLTELLSLTRTQTRNMKPKTLSTLHNGINGVRRITDIKHEIKMKRAKRNMKMKMHGSFWMEGVEWTDRVMNQYHLPQHSVSSLLRSDQDMLSSHPVHKQVSKQLDQLVEGIPSADRMLDDEFGFMYIMNYDHHDNITRSSTTNVQHDRHSDSNTNLPVHVSE